MNTSALMIFMAAGSCIELMLILWLLHFPMRNASIVDAGWSFGVPLCAVVYALLGDGYPDRVWLLTSMVIAWGLRLGLFLLFTRVLGHTEEGRYAALRAKWKTWIGFKFLIFFQFQALLCVVLSITFFFPSRNPAPSLHALEYLGVAIWLIGFLGETTADFQLWRFKSNPANKGRVCKRGLWRYSRHPNYFFELVVWAGWSTFALASPGGYWGLISPLLMFFFLMKVTGIGPTEAQALRSRGQEYAQYQKATSAFLPWFPKES